MDTTLCHHHDSRKVHIHGDYVRMKFSFFEKNLEAVVREAEESRKKLKEIPTFEVKERSQINADAFQTRTETATEATMVAAMTRMTTEAASS